MDCRAEVWWLVFNQLCDAGFVFAAIERFLHVTMVMKSKRLDRYRRFGVYKRGILRYRRYTKRVMRRERISASTRAG